MSVGVFNEVWHRIRPLTPEAYQRFVDYYTDWVVEPNRELLDVLGGFRFVEGDQNTDVTLYRYSSISAIETTSARFGQDPGYQRATEQLFRDVSIEETRTLAFPLSCSTAERLERTLDEEPASTRRYARIHRALPPAERPAARELIARCADEREQAGVARLVAAWEPLFGDVTRSTELWVLAEGARSLEVREGIAPETLRDLDRLAPVSSDQTLEPLRYSRLR